MRLGTMTVTVVVLLVSVSVAGSAESSDFAKLEAALSSQGSRTDQNKRRHRHGSNHPRQGHGARRRRPDSSVPEPLQLPTDLQDSVELVELADGRSRYANPSGDYTVCCPSVEEQTRPVAGRRRDGSLALLYNSTEFQQVFFEHSCDTRGNQPPLRLPKRRTRCVQEYSYSYAVLNIRDSKVLDLIRIRSGCRCEVKPRSSRRKRKRRRDRKRRAEIRRKKNRQRGGQSQTNARNAS